MNKIKSLKIKQIKLFLISLAILLLLINFISAKGFYYSELNQQVAVELSTNTDALFHKIEKLDSVSSIDTTNRIIYFEHKSESEVASQIDSANESKETGYTTSVILARSKSIPLRNLMFAVLSILVVIYAVSFYTVFNASRRFTKQHYIDFAKLLVLPTLLTATVQILVLGVFSRVYSVRLEDILLPIVIVLFGSLIYYKNLFFIRTAKDDANLLEQFRENIAIDYSRILKFTVISLIPVTLITGINFIVPGALLMVGFVFSLLFTNLMPLNFNLPNFKKIKLKRTKTKTIVVTPAIQNKPKKKKTKKTTKSKNKKRK